MFRYFYEPIHRAYRHLLVFLFVFSVLFLVFACAFWYKVPFGNCMDPEEVVFGASCPVSMGTAHNLDPPKGVVHRKKKFLWRCDLSPM